MHRSLGRLLCVALVVAVGCGGGTATRRPPPATQVDTRLGPDDVFDIRVFGEEELTGQYRIAEDGTIDYPLVGRVEIAGLEPGQAADLLSQRLREGQFLRTPQVSIFVREYNSKRVSVVGAVENPGTFPVTAGLTVVEAISRAGGFTSIARPNGVALTRQVGGVRETFSIPVEEITEGSQADITLQPGDIVYVPERVF